MLVQMIDVFEHATFERPRHADVIEQRNMLHVLAQADAARMRTHRHAELRGHQQHDEHFVQTAETATVDLTEIDRLRLQQLLEDHAILAMLAGRDADHRREAPADRGVAEDVVGARRLFDPPRIELRETAHVRDRFIDFPDLIRVHHQLAVGADFLAQNARAPHIFVEIAADLLLEMRPALPRRLRARGGESCRRRNRASRPMSCTRESRERAFPFRVRRVFAMNALQ